MRLDHKPGIDSGIDYGVVVLYLLWIAATIALIMVLAVRSHEPQASSAWKTAFVFGRDSGYYDQVRTRDLGTTLERMHAAGSLSPSQERL
jgi:hypothetical protein